MITVFSSQMECSPDSYTLKNSLERNIGNFSVHKQALAPTLKMIQYHTYMYSTQQIFISIYIYIYIYHETDIDNRYIWVVILQD